MDGSMNNINLANDGYEENQFNAQLVDNLNIEDFQEFISKNQEDTGMAIENNNFSLYDSSDIKDRMQNCIRKSVEFHTDTDKKIRSHFSSVVRAHVRSHCKRSPLLLTPRFSLEWHMCLAPQLSVPSAMRGLHFRCLIKVLLMLLSLVKVLMERCTCSALGASI